MPPGQGGEIASVGTVLAATSLGKSRSSDLETRAYSSKVDGCCSRRRSGDSIERSSLGCYCGWGCGRGTTRSDSDSGGVSTASGHNAASGFRGCKLREVVELRAQLRRRLLWALQTSVSTLLISVWCLHLQTRSLLPMPSFGAFVAIFVTMRSFGGTLHLTADTVCGAALSISVAWLLATYFHGQNTVLTSLALFLQSFFWAYVEIPLASRRLALSTMVIVCLTAHERPEGMPLNEAGRLIALVLLSDGMALLASLVSIWPQLATVHATRSLNSAGRATKLLLEKTLVSFLEADSRRLHIAVVQMAELGRAAERSITSLAGSLDEASWEPRLAPWRPDPAFTMVMDERIISKILMLLGGMQKALSTMPFNSCHSAFAARLEEPIKAMVAAMVVVVPPVKGDTGERMKALEDLHASLAELHKVYGAARRELLYPLIASDTESPNIGRRQTVMWKMEDLLHMNTFLFTLMHLAAEVLADHRTRSAKQGMHRWHRLTWKTYVCGFLKALRPPCPPRVDGSRFRSAFRFAVAISLAAVIVFAPPFETKFEFAIWAPIEVTFLMFKHAGGSLRQSLLRLEGALLGSVAGYLMILFVQRRREALVACLCMWSFGCGLFRGSVTKGYASITAAWTAVIVVDVGGIDFSDPQSGAASAAVERMTHTVVGVACVVFGINFVFPIWARDTARVEVTALLGSLGQLYKELQRALVQQSEQMSVTSPMDDGEGSGLLLVDTQKHELSDLVGNIHRRLAALKGLVAEASAEPALQGNTYHADAAHEVVRNLTQMLTWLRMFSTYIYGNMPTELQDVFNGQEPRRWLSQEWVQSLRNTSGDISAVIASLHGAMQTGGEGSYKPQERPYLNAIHVEGLEGTLRRELVHFLKRYDWILCGAISDSQLKILAGKQTEQFLTNLDMLLYNSLVFAMKGFVQQVLSCSRAIREFLVLEAGSSDAADVVDIEALTGSLPQVEQCQLGWNRPDAVTRESHWMPALVAAEGDSPQSPFMAMTAFVHRSVVVAGRDRLGIVHDLSHAAVTNDCIVGSARCVKLDGEFVAIMRLSVPVNNADTIEADLCHCLRGLQVSVSECSAAGMMPPYQAEVHCISLCNEPGLLLHFTAVLMAEELNIVSLDIELAPTRCGAGSLTRACVTAERPIDEAHLTGKLHALQAECAGSPEAPLGFRINLLQASAGVDVGWIPSNVM